MYGMQFELALDDLLARMSAPVRAECLPDSGRRFSCFVAIVGFEPRCFAAAEFLLKHGASTDISFCVHYSQEEMREVNEAHITTLAKALRSLSQGRDPVPIEHHEQNLQQDFGESLVAAIKAAGFDLDSADTHVAFDISAGSSRLVLEGLHALLQTGATVTVVYSEASEYRPYFDEYCKYHNSSPATGLGAPEFLSIGVDTVDVLRCMPGHSGDARPLYLAAFPCFAPTRIGAVCEEMGPSRIQWLFGVPHLVKNRWRMDAQRDYHSAMVEPQHRHCYISTFDYRETLEVLENISRRRRRDYSVLVCGLGSKLQKLGQVLFHILRPEVGAVVSVPKKWDPVRYSSREPMAIYAVPLGDVAALRKQLWQTRTLRV